MDSMWLGRWRFGERFCHGGGGCGGGGGDVRGGGGGVCDGGARLGGWTIGLKR